MKIINIKKLWAVVFSVFFISFMTACSSGHEGEDEDTTGVVGENAQLNVVVTDINDATTNSITSGNEVNVTATITGSDGNPIEGQRIEFVASLGSLSSESRLSDASGSASVSFDSSGVSSGVVTITTSATVNDESLTFDSEIEILQASIIVEGDPSVAITMKKNGESTNSIQEDETAQLGVELLDSDNQPIADAIVAFTSELGQLSATTALTNALGTAEVTLTPIAEQLGAGLATATVTINETTYVQTKAFQIVSDGVVDQNTQVLIGHFDDDNNFIEGEIKSDLTDSEGNTSIGAGATLGLSVVVVDQDFNRITSATTVSFNSTCVASNDATIDSEVTTINGQAQTTYQDLSCAGSLGNEDEVIATVRVNSADLIASKIITLEPENLGSIEFISSTPESIVLKGTGGQGKQETATLTFLVKGELGNPLNQQTVDFSLNTNVGGLALASNTGVTNADGIVSVKVISGTVPTAVRVTASVTNEDGGQIETQSDLLSVNTGLPDQDSITLALSTINPEAENIITTETVTAYLADSFNNPVPDGTTVNFTTEGGSIEPSCVTLNGNCSVEWTSTRPIPENHRITILATAEGHEYFVDVNGNNVYDDADGGAINDSLTNEDRIISGRDSIVGLTSGFVDMPEAWRDDNENAVYDLGELFIDADDDGLHTGKNGLFNGPQCQGDTCAPTNFITLRKTIVLIAASSTAKIRLFTGDVDSPTIYFSNYEGDVVNGTSPVSIARGGSVTFSVLFSDTQNQIMPAGTTIEATSSQGDVSAIPVTVANARGAATPDDFGGDIYSFSVANNLTDEDPTASGAVTITITAPSGTTTVLSQNIRLE